MANLAGDDFLDSSQLQRLPRGHSYNWSPCTDGFSRKLLRSPSSFRPTRVRAAFVGVPRGGPNEKPRGSTLAGGWPAESRNNEMNMSLFLRVSLVVSTLLPCPKGQLS